MTRVTLGAGGGLYLVTAREHAGDIEACNYITGVLYSFAGFVENEARNGNAEVLRMEIDHGNVEIVARGGYRMDAAFEMACIGLLQLQAERPEAIQVETKDL